MESTLTRTYVTFRSSKFNVSESREGYLRPTNYGDDVAAWFAEQLRKTGWTIEDDPGQERDGWYISYRKPGQVYDLVVQLVNGDTGHWLAWVERAAGIIPSLLGARKKPAPLEAVLPIHDILRGEQEIDDVRWFTREEFVEGKEGRLGPS